MSRLFIFLAFFHFLSCMLCVNSGTLVGDRVRCPFHGACFNVRNGDIEDYPGLDSLPCYKVKWHLSQVHPGFSLS